MATVNSNPVRPVGNYPVRAQPMLAATPGQPVDRFVPTAMVNCVDCHPNKPADHFPLNLSSFERLPKPVPSYSLPDLSAGGPEIKATPLGEVEVKARKQELFQSLQRLQSQPIGVGSEAEFKKLYGLAQQLMGHPQAFSKQELDDLALVVRLGAHKTLVSVPQRAGETAQYYSLSQAATGLLSSAAKKHPDPKCRDAALLAVTQNMSPRQRQTYLLTSGGPGLEAHAARQGGEVGAMVASAMPDGPMTHGDVENLQKQVQGGLTQFLKVCDDEGELRAALQALPAGPNRDLLLSQFGTVRSDLRTLKHCILARQLGDDPRWQWQNDKTVDKQKAEQMFKAILGNKRLTALTSALQGQGAARLGLDGKSEQQKKYLTSEPFLNKVQMLAEPGGKGLNARQNALILEEVARALATESDPERKQQQLEELMTGVYAALGQRGVNVVSVSEEELAKLRADIQSALADPSVSPEEKSMLSTLLPLVKNSKDFAVNSFKIAKALSAAPKVGQAAQATSLLGKGWALGMVAANYLGPVFGVVGVAGSLRDMSHSISEGDATSAQLYLGAAAAGAAGVGVGVATLCLVTGPPGWIAGGLGLIALGLGIAGGLCESDPFQETCTNLGILRPGSPPGPEKDRWLAEKRQRDEDFAYRQSWGYYRPRR